MSAAKVREDATPEQAMDLAQAEAAMMEVLNRGLTVDRLDVRRYLPEDRVGFFVRDRPESIFRMKALGARVENLPQSVVAELGHDSADGTFKVGDVLLMTMSKQQYELIQRVNAKQTAGKLEQSRRDFRAQMNQLGVQPILDREV